MLAVFGLVFLLTIGAFIAAIVFVIRAAIEKRKGADYGRALKHCYIALGTFGGGFVLLMVIAVAVPAPNIAAASTSATTRPRKVAAVTPVPTKTPLATPTAQPTAQHTDSPALQKFRDDWNDITERASNALASADAARKALQSGDSVTASGALKDCEDAASGIKDDGTDMLEDDNSKIAVNLWGAIAQVGDGLGNGCKSLRAYLDDPIPSNAADAKASISSVPVAMEQAEFYAGQKYSDLGGNVDDLKDFRGAK